MFTKIYASLTQYRIYEHANSRFVDEGYPLYQDFLIRGGVPSLEIDASVQNILEIIDGAVAYKPDYQTTLLTKAKTAAKTQLAANRYAKEIGGMTIDGAAIHTDRESQAMLNAAYVMAVNGNLEAGTIWKGSDGWHALTKQNVIDLSIAVKNYVEALFAAEKTKYDLIEAAETVEAVNAIDITF